MTQEQYNKAYPIIDRIHTLEQLKFLTSQNCRIILESVKCSKSGTLDPYATHTKLSVGFEPELLELISKWSEKKIVELNQDFEKI